MRFLQQKERAEGELHCFFEGEDEKYYSGRLVSFLGARGYIAYSCRGKRAVLRVRSLFHSEVRGAPVDAVFFVDRDYSADLTCDDLYVTPAHSIENLYVTEAALRRVLSAEYKAGGQPVPESVVGCIEARMREASEALLEACACVALVEREELNVELNLPNIPASRLVRETGGRMVKQIEGAELRSLFSLEDVSVELVEKQETLLRDVGVRSSVRGKWILSVARELLLQLCSHADSSESVVCNAALQLSKKNLLSELSQYADTPACLRRFLARFALSEA